MWWANLVVNWKKGMALLLCSSYGLRHVDCKGSQLTLHSHVFSWTHMRHSSCTLIGSRSTIHLYLCMRALELPCSLLSVPHWLATHGLVSYRVVTYLLESSIPPPRCLTTFSIVILELVTSPSNRAFTIFDLIVHPPIIPCSMLAWSYNDNDMNSLQHSMLFVGPFAMLPQDNPLTWSNWFT